MIITINETCNECYECTELCSSEVLTEESVSFLRLPETMRLDSDDCTYCEACIDICTEEAIMVTNPLIEE